MKTHSTRRGDGALIEMTSDEIRRDLELGTGDAADRGKIPPLPIGDLDQLFGILTDPNRIVGVEPGREVVLTDDIGPFRLIIDQGNSAVGISLGNVQAIQLHERGYGMDTTTFGHFDASFKAVKPIVANVQQKFENALLNTVIPIFFCCMPNLGAYFRPDGPFPNPSDLLPQGKVKEALESQEQIVDRAATDMIYVCEALAAVGCDGINFDTTGAAGDTDFQATLHAVEHVKQNTGLAVEVGMASEFVLGLHGGLEYDGKRLAGMYPHEQVKVVEKAGADIFGPVINTKPTRSTPWNLARSVTFCKACSEAADIPVHPNVGMGVGGVPMCETPPPDVVSRVSKSLVEIGKADGL